MAYAFRTLRPLFRERGEINAEVTGRLTEALGGIRVVKSYTAEKREEIVFTKGAHRLFRNVAKSMTGVSATTAGSTVIVGIVGVLMIWLGGSAIIAGEMTLGELIMYIFFIGLVAAPLVSIASIGTQITEAFAGLDRIRELLDMTTEIDEDESRAAVETLQGDVRFEDIWFEYNPGQPVLRGVSFHAAPGTTTALVGSSGSGKSTLISLVMAFNRPTKGHIIVDGRDLGELRLMDYRAQLASVLQENFLFDGTIAENVGYARPGATREDIIDACRIAHCDEFISQFPKGYDTVVGERGIKLSGGQRQRVSIARAILANPRILILDEATSSLDSESEQMIQDGLRNLRAGRTTFVIAHRLSTIRSADQILVLEEGQVVERGTHAELLALNGRYRYLHDKQYKFEADRFINPGEDFTPEPETAGGGAASGTSSETGRTHGRIDVAERRPSQRAWRAPETFAANDAVSGRERGPFGGTLGSIGGSLLSNPNVLLTAAGVAWGSSRRCSRATRQPPHPRRRHRCRILLRRRRRRCPSSATRPRR